MKLFFFSSLCLWISVFLFSSCERRELTYYAEAEITITADWSLSGLEGENDYGATALFYPKTGGTPHMVLMGDRNRGRVRLREGHYSVVLFNRSFDDFGAIAFQGRESFHTLEAYVKQVEKRSSSPTIVSSPDKLASAVVEDFEVTADMLGNYLTEQPKSKAALAKEHSLHLTPRELTRTVKIKINIEGLANLKNASCRLSSVPISVFLSNGQHNNSMATQEFSISNPVFNEGSYTAGTLTGEINVFGFDTATEHAMEISALLVDGKTNIQQIFDDVTITEETNEVGTIVLKIEAVVPEPLPDVKPENNSDSGFNADVDEWGKEENTELPL